MHSDSCVRSHWIVTILRPLVVNIMDCFARNTGLLDCFAESNKQNRPEKNGNGAQFLAIAIKWIIWLKGSSWFLDLATWFLSIHKNLSRWMCESENSLNSAALKGHLTKVGGRPLWLGGLGLWSPKYPLLEVDSHSPDCHQTVQQSRCFTEHKNKDCSLCPHSLTLCVDPTSSTCTGETRTGEITMQWTHRKAIVQLST